MDETAISFTEREYDYAHGKGLHVLAFVHEDINSIPHGRVDVPDKVERLKQFTEKISARRLINPWSDRDNLKSRVIISLSKAFNEFPQIGWVRANTAANEDILSQVVLLRKQIDDLIKENDRLTAQLVPLVPNLAPLTNAIRACRRAPAARYRAALCPQSELIGLLLDPAYATMLAIEREYDERSRLWQVHDQYSLARVTAEWHIAAHPTPRRYSPPYG